MQDQWVLPRNLGLHDNLLRRWVKEHADPVKRSFPGHGNPRVWEELRYAGEPCGLNRVARLMKSNAIAGIPSRRQWRKRMPGMRPDTVINHLDRDFSSSDC